MGNCCLFFNNVDESITFFLKASYNLDKDPCLKKFMRLQQRNNLAQLETTTTTTVTNNRRSIVINKRTAEKFSLNKRESIFYSSSHTDTYNIDTENQLLLDYYTRCIHYYDLNGNLEAAIELIQTGKIYFFSF